jgi:hypothetical protein
MDFEKVKKYKKLNYVDLSFEILNESDELSSYLYSGSIFQLKDLERQQLLKALRKFHTSQSYELLFDFIEFSFSTADMYWCVALENIHGLCAEDILSQVEFLGARMLAKNISVDGLEYNDDIINSQHDFLLGVKPVILKFIIENEIQFSGNRSCSRKKQSTKIIESLSHYHSVNTHLNEVLKGFYSVKNINFLSTKYSLSEKDKYILHNKCRYFMERLPEGFDKLETYRDLNYRLEYEEEKSLEKQMELMNDSGMGNYIKEIDLLHFDFSKGKEYETELQFHKVESFLEQIYSSANTSFSYSNLDFRVSDLIEFSKAIYKLASRLNKHNLKNLGSKKSNFISIKGRRSLLRELGVRKNIEILINLFSANSYREIENLPFFLKGDLYYIFPQSIVELCYEKVIDKILSNEKVKLNLPKGIRKGHLFEERLLKMFSDAGIESFSLKGNSNKGIPEIDAIVSIDETNVLVIEAKCTIKPESRFEAFSYLENHLQKAKEQLGLRIEYLSEDSVNESTHSFPFTFTGKNLMPLIVTNHSYFTGMRFKLSDEITVSCIDEFLLKKIIRDKYIPSWIYLPRENSYGLNEVILNDSQETINAIKHPASFLNGMVNKTIQVLEHGVAFEISKHASINWEYKYNKAIKSDS